MKSRKKAAPRHVTRISGAARRRSTTVSTQRQALIRLDRECLVREAPKLKTRLLKVLATPGAVTLDPAALERVDTAGLQVIAAFVIEREKRGLSVSWRGPSAALATAADILGLSGVLKLPV